MIRRNLFTKEFEAVNTYTYQTEHIQITLTQQIKLLLQNKVAIGQRTYNGWKGHLPFYLYRCPKCGNHHIDYPHGFKNQQHLNCEKQQTTTTQPTI
ncbi:MAG: hypothetical protein M1387_05520 [Thaumarchaeota archaeon]|nr:hypothetical protein [Nitrososphaerota archaeon]